MRKIRPNKIQNTPKRVCNREIKYLGNIINTPKIVIEKPKAVTKPKKVSKPKKVDKPKQLSKNRVIKQLEKHFKKLFDVIKK